MPRKYRILESVTGTFYVQAKVKTHIAKFWKTVYKKKWQTLCYDGSISWRNRVAQLPAAKFKTLKEARQFIVKVQLGKVKIHLPTTS